MAAIHAFGPFRLDAKAEILFKGAEPVPLGRRAVVLLRALVDRQGAPLSKDELINAAWPGLAVEESNLTVQIAALRRVFSEEPGGDAWIETLPRRGYRFVGPVVNENKANAPAPQFEGVKAPTLPDKPSIAILPFQNMSGDPEQEYFVDGIVEDVITALSRMRWLFVIARNSSFTYKGRAVDLKQVGRELGVRYVLEGSVRKAANRVRISGQLIDTATGAHLWADRFDGELADVFDLQDRVATSVIGAIAPTLQRAEIERAKRKPTDSLDAYDYFLRGMANVHQWTSDANDEALRMFRKAIELDPDFASAYGMAAWCYTWRSINRWTIDRAQETTEATRLARRAVDSGADDAVALCTGGYALAFVAHDLDGGAALIDHALSLNPNLAWAWHSSGWLRAFLGEPEVAIKHLEHGMRLSPLDPFVFRAYAGLSCAHLLAGRYDEASSWAEKALQRRPNLLVAVREAAASNALAGRLSKAQSAMAQLRQFDPKLRISNFTDWLPLRRPQDIATYENGLRKAGLPD
jgi:TolB-like protein/tetratricopeptide (TPR) repeat protein